MSLDTPLVAEPWATYAAGRAGLANGETLDRAAQRGHIDCRITVERFLYLREELTEAVGIDQTVADHCFDVRLILTVPTLQFREALGIEIEVMESDDVLLRDEGATVFPSRERRDEIGRRGQLHVDVEPLLQVR